MIEVRSNVTDWELRSLILLYNLGMNEFPINDGNCYQVILKGEDNEKAHN